VRSLTFPRSASSSAIKSSDHPTFLFRCKAIQSAINFTKESRSCDQLPLQAIWKGHGDALGFRLP
jgi:hypothetical protein